MAAGGAAVNPSTMGARTRAEIDRVISINCIYTVMPNAFKFIRGFTPWSSKAC